MKALILALVTSLFFIVGGCVVEGHHHCVGSGCTTGVDTGDISFDWTFDTGNGVTPSCSDPLVKITDIYFAIYNSRGGLEIDDYVPCTQSGGVIVYDFLPGNYDIDLEGLDNNTVYYVGTTSGYIAAGVVNDFGAVPLHLK